MAVEIDMIGHVSDLLASGDSKSLKSIMKEEMFEQVLQEKANDLIPVASYYINKETVTDKPVVFRCSKKVIMKCAEKGNPKECLMEFLAQIESLDEVKFQNLLIPIQTTMLRIPDRKGPLMQCVFNVIYSFINSLPLPQYHDFDSKSKLLLECDENYHRIRDVYELIVGFYEPFVEEVSGKCNSDKRISGLRAVLLQALFQLLGNPLVTQDLELNEKGGSSRLRVLASKIIKYIQRLLADPLYFLTLVEEKQLITVGHEKSLVDEFSSNETKFSYLSVSVFFYLILCEDMWPTLPCVYDKCFIFQNSLSLAVNILNSTETLVVRKGLFLVKATVEKVEPGSINFLFLTSDVHKEAIEYLSKAAVFQENEENRKLAAGLIKKHFSVFEPKAQYYILLNSSHCNRHPSILGYFTTLFTGLVQNSFTRGEYKEYFTGKRLFDLLNVYCSLKEGAETDLVENKDQILAALNLIIFLTRRDRENVSGIWNYTSTLFNNFLSPLREGINLSRAHYKLQLKSLDDPLKTEDGAELAVNVGGQELGKMSTEEKKSVINSGLTVFDLIEHVLSRTNECIEDNPLKIDTDIQ